MKKYSYKYSFVYKLILTISLTAFLFSCGGGGDSVSDAINTPTTTGISNSTGASGTYTLSASGLEGKEVYAVISNCNLSSSTETTTTIDGVQSVVSSSKSVSSDKKEILPIIDIDQKFRKNLPELVKSTGTQTSKATGATKASALNSTKTFAVTVTDNSGSSDANKTIAATLKKQHTGTRTFNIWVDDASPVDDTYLNNLLDNFCKNTNNIYSYITNIYGVEWGTHNYGNLIPYSGEVDILLTPLNKYYDSNANGFIMGYFAPKDTFTQSFLNSEGYSISSNEKNMFYIDSRLFAKNTSLSVDSKQYYHNEIYGTLAHEFTHMLMYYQKNILKNSHAETWLDETLAMISEDLMDDKITLQSGTLLGSKSRINGFNKVYKDNYGIFKYDKNAPIIDKDGDYTLENYAANGVFGLYLTRAYGTSSLAFLRNIMQSTYKNYDAIEKATGDSFSVILQNYAKALMISSDSSISSSKIALNKSFNSSYGAYTYKFEPINIFDSAYTQFDYLNKAIEGSGTSFRKLKGSTGATGNWTFNVPTDNMPFQIIVKNADGTFDSAKTSELNSAIVKK